MLPTPTPLQRLRRRATSRARSSALSAVRPPGSSASCSVRTTSAEVLIGSAGARPLHAKAKDPNAGERASGREAFAPQERERQADITALPHCGEDDDVPPGWWPNGCTSASRDAIAPKAPIHPQRRAGVRSDAAELRVALNGGDDSERTPRAAPPECVRFPSRPTIPRRRGSLGFGGGARRRGIGALRRRCIDARPSS